ncbi:MAG: hypothetical protein NPINA01_10410 [Nitrospinaceae bacterium]|nr:MAG: hypothetical protein NPINA01_10410 [Nitrospinaceae bacterium]
MSDRANSEATRRLTVIAQDPKVRVNGKILTAKVEIPAEGLDPGPTGYRIQVIDYDTTRDRFIKPGPAIVDDPFEHTHPNQLVDDPDFHAQNVYTIVMSILSRFERALGRRVQWGFTGNGHQIKVVPHAFADANAYYSRDQEALMFGYFRGQRRTVFTCLSHDIVAHEATHALVDGLRSNYLLPSSPDQAAFHEGFSDVVSLLSVFRMREVVDAMLQSSATNHGSEFVMSQEELTVDKLKITALMQLAEEMGQELTGVRGEPLRHSLKLNRSPRHLQERVEPHERGEILVAAMLRSMLEVWVRRLFPNGRRGVKVLDRIHVVREGAKAADHLLTMAIRALDYTPPVDLQFGDYLSALLTADVELNRDDSQYEYRDALRKCFTAYGIKPGVRKPVGEAGAWNPPLGEKSLNYDRTRHDAMKNDPEEVFRFIWENRKTLQLKENAYTFVQSVRPTVRVNTDGFVLRETVAEYVQILRIRADELGEYGLKKPEGMNDWTQVTLNGGGTLVFNDYGRLKFNIGSGVSSKKQQRRIDYLFETGHFDDSGALPLDLAKAHRLRGGGPGLRDPYLERRD